MKLFFTKHQEKINILFSAVTVLCIFYTGALEQTISQIHTDYLIDAVALNNSFITLNIHASM